jgi:hypothetical protein
MKQHVEEEIIKEIEKWISGKFFANERSDFGKAESFSLFFLQYHKITLFISFS